MISSSPPALRSRTPPRSVLVFFSGIFCAYHAAKLPRVLKWILDVVLTLPLALPPTVWWRLAKEKCPRPFPGELGIDPANVLLLYA